MEGYKKVPGKCQYKPFGATRRCGRRLWTKFSGEDKITVCPEHQDAAVRNPSRTPKGTISTDGRKK